MTTELYRKYRPKTLDRVVGNEETVQSIREMLAKVQLPHCILFSGPSGTGKTTCARIVASELKCHSMDLVELNCSNFRGIDTIRDIQRVMDLSPVGGPCRVWILDEVHQMSKDGQNAALKMLEDMPDHVYFLLCTTDPQKLIPTILTRCCHMPVRLLDDDEIATVVRRVAKKEEIAISDDVLGDLATFAAGSARTALVLLDKVRNLPPEKQVEAMQQKAEEEREAIDLCRALLKREPWEKIGKILKTLKGEPESIRWAVLGYARSCLLGSGGKGGHTAYSIICAFEEPFYDSKAAGLARACYEATFAD